MKKAIKSLAMGLVCLIGTAACDTTGFQNGGSVSVGSSIVGTWITYDGDWFYGLQLSQGGTGIYFELEGPDEMEILQINYAYNANNATFSWWFQEDGEEEFYSCEVLALTSEQLILRTNYGDGTYETEIFTRVDRIPDLPGNGGNQGGGNQGGGSQTPAEALESIICNFTWAVIDTDPSWQNIVTFSSNGTYKTVQYYDIEGDGSFAELHGRYAGTWTISGNRLTMRETELDSDGNTSFVAHAYNIVSIANDSFTVTDEWNDEYTFYKN